MMPGIAARRSRPDPAPCARAASEYRVRSISARSTPALARAYRLAVQANNSMGHYTQLFNRLVLFVIAKPEDEFYYPAIMLNMVWRHGAFLLHAPI